MYPVKDNWIPGPFRVRQEPPTIKEAIAAAEAMTDNVEQQLEFAAGLMGITIEEVRPHLKSFGSTDRSRRTEVMRYAVQTSRPLVVERKIRRIARG